MTCFRSTRRRALMPALRAFTLIELLVVIAIIAILAAILFPVFAQAREKARQSTCLSNNKQYALALMMYVQDYDETFPYSAYFNVAATPPCVATYLWSVAPYVKNDQLTTCPSEKDAMDTNLLVGQACVGTPRFNSYAVNPALFANGFNPTAVPLALAALPRSADTIMNFDGNATFEGAAPQRQIVQARHSETFTASYADGHVKALKAILQTATAQQFTVVGPGKQLKTYLIGAAVPFYGDPALNNDRTQAKGIPQ